jgi:para-nitrobenzyl esterase
MAVPNRTVMTMDSDGLERRLERVLPGGTAAAAIEQYTERLHDLEGGTQPADIFCAVLTDVAFRVPTERMLDAVADRCAPAYRYHFTWPSPAVRGLLGACHAVDLGFTFGTNEVNGGEQFFGAGREADLVVDHVQRAWTAFAKNDDPNDAGQPRWRAYDSRDRATMEIGVNPGIKDDPWRDLRELWASIPDEILRRF